MPETSNANIQQAPAKGDRRSPSRIRQWCFRAIGLVLGCVAAVVLVEVLCSAYAFGRYHTLSVEKILEKESGNAYVAEIERRQNGYVETLAPHPYLGYVHNKTIEGPDSATTTTRYNNVGLIGRDFPLVKDPRKFTILFTGGSVANQFCRAGEGPRNYLEQLLNERYNFAKEIVVLNGACGAWQQPQQSITLMLYGDAVDAVVTLDGANEFQKLKGFAAAPRLELPYNDFRDVNPIAVHGYERLAVSWQTNQLKRFAQAHNWRTIYFATRFARNYLVNSVRSDVVNGEVANVDRIFALPADWSAEQKRVFNLKQYQKYIRLMSAMAGKLGIKQAYFIQPVPSVDKPLTDEERIAVGDLSFGDAYRKTSQELLTLRGEGIPINGLLDVFAETRTTVYEDSVHCRFQEPEPGRATYEVNFLPSEGYKIIAEAIAAKLADEWKIPKR